MPLLNFEQMMKAFVWFANRSEKARSLIRGDRIIQLQVEGEKPCFIKISKDGFSYQDGLSEKPDVTLRTTRETILRLLSGELRQEEAFTLRKIEVAGSMVDAVRFNQITQAVMPSSGILAKIVKSMAS